ncbi:MAG: hypothetical protein R2753_08415, partial [Chitinophagales bacterium]
IAIITAILGLSYGYWMYNKPHENIEKSKISAHFQANELMASMEGDAEDLKLSLQNQVISVEGDVKNISRTDDQYLVSFDNGGDYIVLAYFKDELSELNEIKEGDKIKFKGKYAGVIINDEDFMIPADIKVENCYLINE